MSQTRADWRKDLNLPPTFDNYGFNVTPAVLVKEFGKLGNEVRWPLKTNKPKSNPDSKLWCEFHGDYRHRKINHVQREKTPTKLPPPPPHHKVINYIAGGSEICGATYSQAKMIARGKSLQVSSADIMEDDLVIFQFGDTDMEHIVAPQHDSLVISLPIGNYLIKRILVDNGSDANIMMFDMLFQMGLSEANIEKIFTTLVSFSSETKRTIGEIHLPTYVGGINLFQRLLVIAGGSTYNIILGQAWIHDIKAVPSKLH
ncbi:uncharacterized protein LOC141691067 [Apium graveolens]|uniref:uncharacterized protein LOC141691067 n=1 Tax=Apium graveolens TaxID=4045 RepID=UPI003D7A65A3